LRLNAHVPPWLFPGGCFLLALLLLAGRMFQDKGVGDVGHLGDQEQVVSAEPVRRLPLAGLAPIEPRQGDVEPRPLLALVLPDRRSDVLEPDGVDGPSLRLDLLCGGFFSLKYPHGSFLHLVHPVNQVWWARRTEGSEFLGETQTTDGIAGLGAVMGAGKG